MKKQLSTIILLLVFLISCSSVPEGSPAVDGSIRDTTIINQESVISYIEPIVVGGVINFTDSEYSFMWDTSPVNGILFFFTSMPRMGYREKEIESAVLEVARQASMLYNTKVDAKFATKGNSRDFSYLEEINIQYDHGLAKDIKSRIEVVYHFRDREGTYILAKLDGIKFTGNIDIVTIPGDTPDWILNIPEIPGYLVTVGAVQRSFYKIDSIRAADEQALADLAKQISVVVKAKRTDIETNQSGSAFKEINYEVTSTYIKGFYALGRWSTDNGNTYYTLAVCPENQ